jgi:hypothetical protein
MSFIVSSSNISKFTLLFSVLSIKNSKSLSKFFSIHTQESYIIKSPEILYLVLKFILIISFLLSLSSYLLKNGLIILMLFSDIFNLSFISSFVVTLKQINYFEFLHEYKNK